MTYYSRCWYMGVFQYLKRLFVPFGSGSRSGQAMVEYAVVAGILLSALAVFYLFQGTFAQFGARVLSLVGSEYP